MLTTFQSLEKSIENSLDSPYAQVLSFQNVNSLVDGQFLSYGDSNVDFPIESCGKPLQYSIAVEDQGYDFVENFFVS